VKKYFIATLAAVAIFVFSASAASLTVNSGTLQAGQNSIGTCSAPDISAKYEEPSLDEQSGKYFIDQIILDHGYYSDGDETETACMGLGYRVSITGGDPVQILSTGSGTFGTGNEKVTLEPALDAQQATDVHVIVGDLPEN
jgi:hypothetical protein